MKESPFAPDESAVSDVLGVVLMVALTVILATVANGFVLDAGAQDVESPPQAVFGFETDDCHGEKLRIAHRNGESIPADELYLRSDELELSGSWAAPSGYSTSGVADGTVSAGDSATVCSDALDDARIEVVWDPESSDQSVILAAWDR